MRKPGSWCSAGAPNASRNYRRLRQCKRCAVQAVAWEWTITEYATFHLWMRVWHTPRFPQVVGIRCFSAVMAVQLLADIVLTEHATFQSWMSVWHTPKFLLVVSTTQFFSEVMAVQSLAELMSTEHATFHLWMRVWHTRRFLQVVSTIQCFSEVMAVQLLAERIFSRNAIFHRWMRVCRRWLAYGASPKWWRCNCLRTQWSRRMWNSISLSLGVSGFAVSPQVFVTLLHSWFEAAWGKTRACFATLLESWGWCHHSHMFGFGRAWSTALKGQWSWLSCGGFQSACIAGWWATASCCLARWAVVRGSLRRRSICHTCDSLFEAWESVKRSL